MHTTTFLRGLALLAPQQQGSSESLAMETLKGMLGNGIEIATLLLVFTLAIFVVLVFGVRMLLAARKQPIPTDPFDMAKPKDFRTLMVAAAALLAPLVAQSFLPVEGLEAQWVLVWAYVFQIVLALILWLALHLLYQVRDARRQS
jgi:uncharacterized iron-regulated membrane protein